MRIIENTTRKIREYGCEERTAWDSVQQEHNWAMLAFEIEALVEFGIFVNRITARMLENWHEWVSQDGSRYDHGQHETLQSLGQQLVETNVRVHNLIVLCENKDFEIKQSCEFNKLAQLLRSSLLPGDGQLNDEFAKLRDDAAAEHEAGRTTSMSTWGQ